jgi:hypothetical protein
MRGQHPLNLEAYPRRIGVGKKANADTRRHVAVGVDLGRGHPDDRQQLVTQTLADHVAPLPSGRASRDARYPSMPSPMPSPTSSHLQ